MSQEVKQLKLNLPLDLRKQVGVSAAENMRSLSAEVVYRLRQAYAAEEATAQK
ncbi:Arc family DNA-binding protein [Tranquillimonas rosea]|uniref:Arc family DNA-binding protein n=1 Tax=Tranquillimonas rosea TaxID=641238 RepID=UPI003BACCBE1